MKLIFNQYRR